MPALSLQLAPVPELGAGQIYDAILAFHPNPEWCVLAEVADATSGRASRRADAIAMNMWSSRGLEIRGFEIKVSRSDLKRELEDPSKADAVGQYCHTWSLSVPAGLVRATDPVPAAWGLFEVDAKGVGKFTRQPAFRPPEEVKAPTRMFTAAIARAATAELHSMRTSGAWIRRDEIDAKLAAEFQRGRETAPDERRQQVAQLEAKLAEMQPIIDALGIKLDGPSWAWDDGDAVAKHLAVGKALCDRHGWEVVNNTLTIVERAAESLRDVAKNLKVLQTKDKA